MSEKFLEEGAVIDIAESKAKKIVRKYSELFEINEDGQLTVLENDTVQYNGNHLYYIDDDGKKQKITEFTVTEDKGQDIDEDEDEEDKEDKGQDIDEDEEDEEDEEDKGKDADENQTSEKKYNNYSTVNTPPQENPVSNAPVTVFDGELYRYYPKRRLKREKYTYDPNNPDDHRALTAELRRFSRELYRYSPSTIAGKRRYIRHAETGRRIPTVRDPLSNRILSDEDLEQFCSYLNEVDGIKTKNGGRIDVREFQKEKRKKIGGTYLTTSDGNKLYLNESDVRAEILNNADTIADRVSTMQSTTKGLHMNVPVKKCLRYVGNLGLAKILEQCRNCSYKDIISGKGKALNNQVQDCLTLLNLEHDTDLHTKQNLVDAMNIWTSKFNELQEELDRDGKERFMEKYRAISNNIPENNLCTGTNRWKHV